MRRCGGHSRRQPLASSAIAAARVARIALGRRAVLVIAKGQQRPHPRRSCGRRIGLIDAADEQRLSGSGWTMLFFAAFLLTYSLRLKGRVLIDYAIPQWKRGPAIFAEKVMIPRSRRFSSATRSRSTFRGKTARHHCCVDSERCAGGAGKSSGVVRTSSKRGVLISAALRRGISVPCTESDAHTIARQLTAQRGMRCSPRYDPLGWSRRYL
jgi:hypothetical protein